jgi:5-methylcytosine-specific restriction endonuclease McrA
LADYLPSDFLSDFDSSEVSMTDYQNPGEELREYLSSFYQQQSPHFLQKMDRDLECDGEFERLVYNSCLNYLLRRLVKTAEYYRRQHPSDWRMKMKSFLRDHTGFRTGADEIIKLLGRCLDVRDDEPTAHLKKQIRKQTLDNRHGCYLCGEAIDYQEIEIYLSPTVDHSWPRGLGGASQRFNLRVAHQKCNNDLKQDHIDASDYHYEQICAVSTPDDQDFTQEMKPLYKMAVLAKSNFGCAVCEQPAFRVGALTLGRKNPSDSWHFLNLEAYCEVHKPRK